jgi:inner membrane protein
VERTVRGENDKERTITEFEEHRQIIVPSTLQVDGKVQVEERYRGLYKAQMFHLGGTMRGTFVLPGPGRFACGGSVAKPARATLVMGITDLRGVQNQPILQWGGAAHAFLPGSGTSLLKQGIHVDLGAADTLATGTLAFAIPLEILGTQVLSLAPVAEETQVTLQSPWTEPSFGGRFLPVRRQVDEKGFVASWKVSSLARNLDEIFQARDGSCTQEAFEVSFMDPINIYLQAERAVKYGFLFVGLTFAAFFLFEVLRRLRIHPMQYLLVGMALAMFFLLLISLSEHIPFLWAYILASGASILLIGCYLVHVLQSKAWGAGFAAGLTVLHAVLYGLLLSEDNAQLMGALLLFAALAAVMTATRKLDWYGIGREP